MSAGAMLESPLFLVSLGLWAINDHWLKGAYGNWATGKLSDAACLVAIPLMAGALVELWRSEGRSLAAHRFVLASAGLCAITMGLINLWPTAGLAYEWGLGALQWPLVSLLELVSGRKVPGVTPVKLWMDATDVLTIPFALVPVCASHLRTHARFKADETTSPEVSCAV